MLLELFRCPWAIYKIEHSTSSRISLPLSTFAPVSRGIFKCFYPAQNMTRKQENPILLIILSLLLEFFLEMPKKERHNDDVLRRNDEILK